MAKIHRFPVSNSLAIILFLFCLISCSKEEEKNSVLVSSSYKKVMPVSLAQIIMQTLESYEPGLEDLKSGLQYDVDIYSISYNTLFKGEKIVASGLICVPKANGNFPVISFQNGTNTKHGQAPSMDLNNSLYSIMQSMASLGFIVFMPDYLGFGSSDNILHPYHHRESNDQVLTDMLKAGKEFLQQDRVLAHSDGRLFLMGYSQGGWATLSLLKSLESTPDLAFELTAVSCGAGGYDLMAITRHLLSLEVYEAPHYLPYFVESRLRNELMAGKLDDFFQQPYANTIPDLFNGDYSNSELSDQLNDTIARLLTPGLMQEFESGTLYTELRNQLAENSILAWNTPVPLMLGTGSVDTNVPPFITEDQYQAFIETGKNPATLVLEKYEGKNHDTGLIPWGIRTIRWFRSF